jgi:hypothetical protein
VRLQCAEADVHPLVLGIPAGLVHEAPLVERRVQLLGDLVKLAVECGLVEVDGEIRVAGVPVLQGEALEGQTPLVNENRAPARLGTLERPSRSTLRAAAGMPIEPPSRCSGSVPCPLLRWATTNTAAPVSSASP